MEYNVFISWSGPRSRAVGSALHKYIPDVLQNAIPWMSSIAIESGRRWNNEVQDALAQIKLGVLCVTPENLTSTWLHFEAGALSRQVKRPFVCPYLLGIEQSQIKPPLADFQCETADEAGTLNLIQSLNSALGKTVDPDRVKRAFDSVWPKLKKDLDQIRNQKPEGDIVPPARQAEDMFAEILGLLRAQANSPRVVVSDAFNQSPFRRHLEEAINRMGLSPEESIHYRRALCDCVFSKMGAEASAVMHGVSTHIFEMLVAFFLQSCNVKTLEELRSSPLLR